MKRTCTNNVLSTTRRRFGGRPILQQQQQQPFIKHITTKPAVFSTYSIRHLWSCRGGGGGNVLSRTYPTSRTSSLHSTTRTVCSSWHDNDQENNNNNNSADEEAIEDTDTKNIRFLNQIRHSLCQDILSTVLSQQVSDLSSSVSNQRNDPPPSCVVLLSVSGGCDSVALLHSMMELVEPYRNERGDVVAAVDGNPPMYPQHCFRRDDDASNNNIIMELHVVHFDHCQRGEASDGDRRLVEHLAQSMGLAFHCFYWHDDDDDDYNKNSRGAFTQEVARTWRISKLSQLLQSLTNHHHPLDTKTLEHTRRPGVILTAHHQDDSNETLLLKLLRGVHLSNLSGMEPLTTIRIRKERHDDDDDEEEEEEKTAMFGRPMLRVKKSSIVDFLQSRQYTWREDASNQSDKYLRNRVRNELVPLLTDLVGGDDSLQKRLDNLVQQSQELHQDTCQRTSGILETCASVSENYFLLPEDLTTLDYIRQQAIYVWANQVMQGHLLPYDQFVRLCTQLKDSPFNRQWTINLGGGWDVVRNGNALRMKFMDRFVNHDASEQEIQWSLVGDRAVDVDKRRAVEFDKRLQIRIPSEFGVDGKTSVQFVLTKSNVDDLLFTPSWRTNHSPMKLREFLRGQRVPLHLRSTAPTILAKHGSERHVVAVYVVEGDRWVVDARFAPGNPTNESRALLLHWQ